MKPSILRPKDISKDKREELRAYLHAQWLRAERTRREQVDGQYADWDKAYYGVPLEENRTVPFYKASNFVVKLIRMFLDTFCARTLNIIHATKPLFVCDSLPKDLRDAADLYINKKALYDWNYYILTRELCKRGNKNGTVVTKTIYDEKTTIDVMPSDDKSGMKETDFKYYAGPCTSIIPFEDFYIYPITANCLEEAEIKFHRVRYSKEAAQRLVDKKTWTLPEGKTLASYLKLPRDVKKTSQQQDAGAYDQFYEELQLVESHLQYAITNDASKVYEVICLIEPNTGDMFDLYYNPYPRNLCLFNDYRPFPREEMYYGESMCQLLGQSQEEASRIHNERRDNSMLANTLCFKRRSGSLLPNPSTNWYPGKVWDLEDMTDLETFDIGRNYNSTIEEEQFCMQLAEKLSGIGPVMQGAASDQSGKGGTYNTMGVIALMQEGNQRQDTNIRDVREALGCLIKTDMRLQSYYGKDDPLLETFEPQQRDEVAKVLEFFASDNYRFARLEVKSSDAGVNKEVERMNLMQCAQIVNQYGQATLQIAQQLLDPSINPGLRMLMNDQVKMMRMMAMSIMKQFDEFELAEEIPDVAAAIEAAIPGGSKGSREASKAGPGMDNGGANGSLPAVSRSQVASLAAMPALSGGGNGSGGMAP